MPKVTGSGPREGKKSTPSAITPRDRSGLPVVLFVDDEESLLEGIRVTLRKEPIDVETASSADIAMKVLERRSVSVIVSDERMPGVSGAKFLTAVRESNPDTVRIILSGQANFAAAMQAINGAEVFRFLTKPIAAPELRKVIQEALAFHESKRNAMPVPDDEGVRKSELRSLECEHPGITQVNRDADGSIVVDWGDDVQQELDALMGVRAG